MSCLHRNSHYTELGTRMICSDCAMVLDYDEPSPRDIFRPQSLVEEALRANLLALNVRVIRAEEEVVRLQGLIKDVEGDPDGCERCPWCRREMRAGAVEHTHDCRAFSGPGELRRVQR